jgi:hypothetical protein
VISTDGLVQPLYTGEASSPVTSISATSGVTGTGSHVDINRGKGIYPSTTTTYYHDNQVSSSTLITAGYGWPVWQATYLPFGEEYNPELTDGEHYKFTRQRTRWRDRVGLFWCPLLQQRLGKVDNTGLGRKACARSVR